MAARSRGRFVKTPSKKIPSSTPEGIAAMVSPVSNTDCEWLAWMAIGSMAAAHPTVARRASLNESAGAPEPTRKKSTTVVEAREFKAALRLAMAAARIAAMAKPAAPGGRLFHRNWG